MIPIWKLSGRLGNQMFQLAYMYAQVEKGEIPDIYVQDEKYFENVKNYIKALYGDDIHYIPRVAIHVRRGDYVNNPFYVDLTQTDYYKKAMDEFKGSTFLVFSDDIEWCKKQEIFKGCEFSEGSEIDDFNKMAGCIGHIIANSSFSWWAAYIAKWSSKVIAPKAWYADGVERTKVPESWLRL